MTNYTVVGFGECNLQDCDIQQSLFRYRPSLAANGLFIALFVISLSIHLLQGFRLKQWTFGSLLAFGCAIEAIGYGGRIIMNDDPWSFAGFMLQIICITAAPVFMTAAIYITLYKSIMYLDPSCARFKPALYYQIFIPCDIISLVLQAAGGAMSTQSRGSSETGVNIALAGLSFQVFTLFAFIVLFAQYAIDFRRKSSDPHLDRKFITFAVFGGLATILIFIRCAYRIYELHQGYSGTALHDECLFVALESCMVILAVFALNVGNPGLAFRNQRKVRDVSSDDELSAKA